MILGISGVAGSGKDTAADVLVETCCFAKVAFADPMKRFAQELWDFSDDQLWGPSELRNAPDLRYPLKGGGHVTPRRALQILGTEFGRAVDEDVWVRYALRVAKILLSNRQKFDYTGPRGLFRAPARAYCGVVIPDVRFLNEACALGEAGGYVVVIDRPGAGLTGKAGQHASEQSTYAIAQISEGVVDNDGTIQEFRERVVRLVGALRASEFAS